MVQANYQLRFCPKNQNEILRFHFHDEIEFLMPVTKGGRLWIEDKIYSLEPGALFVMSEHTLHHLSTDQTPYERYILHVSPADLAALSTPRTDLLACFNQSFYAMDISRHTERFIMRMAAMDQERAGEFGGDIRRAMAFLDFLLDVGSMIPDAGEAPQLSGDPNVARVLEIQRYIRANSSNPLTLEQIAGEFFISKYHLSHIFKAVSNYTVIEYLNYCRVSKACRMLRGRLDTSHVGEAAGFGSPEQFLRTFKHWMGMTPLQYSKKYREALQLNHLTGGL